MKIISFSYSNYDWHLKDATFDDINLLVGLSGVGKTRILLSIINLKNVANGSAANGVKWDMKFFDSQKKQYCWNGEFSETNEILSENLICDEEVLIERKKDQIKYRETETPKLPLDKSAIYLLKEEPVKSILNEINKILIYDHAYYMDIQQSFNKFDKITLQKEFESNDILNSKLDISMKLFLISSKDKALFNKIEKLFCDIFPFIESIKIDLLPDSYQKFIPQFLRDVPVIQIKEKNIDKWIPQFEISSGMFSALMHLCELYLCEENSVILIDELENGLGINCLGPISDEIIDNTKNTQFIITSHHPTIINSIKYDSWKVVTRNANNVSVSKYSIDTAESAHDPYMQLINSIEYNEGIIK